MHFQFTVYDALNGLFLFLPLTVLVNIHEGIVCQRPKRASFISTMNEELKTVEEGTECQRPKRASFISTKITDLFEDALSLCQRPKRASFISTVPSETPHKHWLPSLIFAGICLNLLTTTVFRKFFGMFTLYSYFSM